MGPKRETKRALAGSKRAGRALSVSERELCPSPTAADPSAPKDPLAKLRRGPLPTRALRGWGSGLALEGELVAGLPQPVGA